MAVERTTRRQNLASRRKPVRVPKSSEDKFKYRLFNLGVGLDLPLLLIILTLLGIGLIMLFSSSFPAALYYKGDSYYYIKRQAVFAGVGIVAMLIISVIDYHQIRKYNYILFGVTVFLLILVFIPPFSRSEGEATRWIGIGSFTFQPSEVAKFTLIVMLAHLITKSGEGIRTFKHGVMPCGIAIGIVVGLIALEKHISAIIILLCISAIVMFIGGVKLRWFVLVGGIAIFAIMFLVFFSDAYAYTELRILGWLNPFNPPINPATGKAVDTHQTVQSLYAIGAGGFLGVGLGQSKQKYIYLPEAKNDFIFPIACEELGFIGALIIILLFLALIWRGVIISMNARDKFGSLLAMGITFTIGLQAIFNICVVSNAFPNTGISLPFFSYGGTSLLMLLGEMGVLLSISRNSYNEKT